MENEEKQSDTSPKMQGAETKLKEFSRNAKQKGKTSEPKRVSKAPLFNQNWFFNQKKVASEGASDPKEGCNNLCNTPPQTKTTPVSKARDGSKTLFELNCF